MPTALAILVGCQLVGDVLCRLLHLPLPGPVVGMFLLAVGLVARSRFQPVADRSAASPLGQTANMLIANMGLLFVPAGVGVIAQFGVLRQAWLPILAALLISTVLGLVVTGLVMQRVSRAAETARRVPPVLAGGHAGHPEGR